MKKKCIILLFVSLGACSNQPRNVKINSNYEYGFSISETPENFEELKRIGEFCIKISDDISLTQSLIERRYGGVYHQFNLDELVSIINQLNSCSNLDQEINIINLDSKISYFSRGRYDGYTIEMKTGGNYECNGSDYQFSVENSAGLENLSFIGDKKEDALIASSTVLAFYKVIQDIHKQMVLDCNQ